MRILVHGINFDPEPTGIGKYTGEMVAELVRRGHEVRVVTAPPYYPGWQVFDGWRNAASVRRWQGATVYRAPLWVPRQPSGAKRVMHLALYSMAALPQLLRQWVWRPQVVMVVAPAMACAPWAWLLAKASGAASWLHVQDFEIDAAFRLGMLTNRTAQGLLKQAERWVLQAFDRVSTISGAMLAHAEHHKGVARAKLVYLPNWVDDKTITPLPGPSSYRAALGIGPEQTVVLFSGTLGGKQGLEMLPEAARQLAARRDIVFVICGNGVLKPMIEQATLGMANVRLLPLQPYEKLNELLGMADIHVLTQHPGAADLVMPSKLGGMLASGRPVVTTAADGTELAQVVQHCGRVVPPGALQAFCEALVELADNRDLRQALGSAARKAAVETLGKDSVLTRLDLCLRAVAARSTAGVELPVGTEDTYERQA